MHSRSHREDLHLRNDDGTRRRTVSWRLQHFRPLGLLLASLLLAFALPGCPPRSGPVEVSFTAAPKTGPAPLVVAFEGSAVAVPPYQLKFRDMNPTEPTVIEITGWSWDFGDGQTGGGQETTHTYAAPGTYNVSLSVSTSDGSKVTEEKK